MDAGGMLLDFSKLKSKLTGWIESNWDHAFLLNDQDHVLIDALTAIPESRLFLFKNANPTAENLAKALYESMHDEMGDILDSVQVWETAAQYARYGET